MCLLYFDISTFALRQGSDFAKCCDVNGTEAGDDVGAVGFGYVVAGNIVTPTFLPLALIACMVGLASVFAGTNHLRVWRGDSLSSAASTSLIAWLLTLLAMGVACKEIHTGGSNRQKRLVSLEPHCHITYPPTLHAPMSVLLLKSTSFTTLCKSLKHYF